jgi:hypothetical protein
VLDQAAKELMHGRVGNHCSASLEWEIFISLAGPAAAEGFCSRRVSREVGEAATWRLGLAESAEAQLDPRPGSSPHSPPHDPRVGPNGALSPTGHEVEDFDSLGSSHGLDLSATFGPDLGRLEPLDQAVSSPPGHVNQELPCTQQEGSVPSLKRSPPVSARARGRLPCSSGGLAGIRPLLAG